MQYEDKLLCIIRYYKYPFINPETKNRAMLYKLEKWTENDVTYWEQHEDLTWTYDYSYDINPASHWVDENKSIGKVEKNSFGRVPFVPVYNNPQLTTDLDAIKALIDSYDKVFSGWINDLEDIKQLILILKGYEGLMKEGRDGKIYDLEQYLKSLYSIGAITVKEDGDVTNLKNEIPIQARKEALDLCEKLIYKIGRIVDPSAMTGGSITNIAIKALFAGLEAKCNAMLSLFQESIEQMMWFHVFWINRKYKKNYDYKQIKFSFNVTQPFNEVEYMNTLNSTRATGDISLQTYLEKSTFVDNADEEITRIEAERKRKLEANAASLDQYMNEGENGDANLDESVQENENQQNNEQRK
jgi:SPP1 family phage portal protein